jgi:predicted DNA-binding WGR domain protein
MRRFVHDDEQGQRFWQLALNDRAVELHWGLVGTNGSRLVKELPNAGKARAEHDRLVRQRLGMGYVEVDVEDGPASR